MKIVFTISTCLFLLTIFSCVPKERTHVSVHSPNKQLEVFFEEMDSGLYYSVKLADNEVVSRSKLGFEFKGLAPLEKNLKIVDVVNSAKDESWQQVWGEKKVVRNNYQEAIIMLQEEMAPKRMLNIIFRVFDDGIGFRYEIPRQEGMDSIFITNELTEFNLAQDYSTWFIPANFDSYEFLYQNKPASQVESANTPVTFESAGQNIFISIHEANLTNYAGMTLKKREAAKPIFKADLVPWPDGIKVRAVAPIKTPWRTIQLCSSPEKLIESSLILNLNEPNQLQDVSWIKPAKYIGIWWGMHLGIYTWAYGDRHGATTDRMKEYIDFAAENNIQGVLAEGWNTGWENWGQPHAFDMVTPYDDFDLEEITSYAKTKGVDIIGHHETGGDAEYYEQQMEKAFQLCNKFGINYVKTGYAGTIRPLKQFHHGQYMVNHYRKVVETAAKYHIMLDVHEPIKPTGIRRTYPNMMTREGVRGMEWNAWESGNAPEHHVVLPFTRILAGPVDYTPGIFDALYQNAGERSKWNSYSGESRLHTTLSKQLALFVVFYSPLQMASDLIKNYKGQPAFQFIRDVPTDWEYTKVLNAKIGDYLAIVRKDMGSDDWYLGSITDENSRNFNLKLDFLDPNITYTAEVYADTEESDWKSNPMAYTIKKQIITSKDSIEVNLAPGGGQAIRFKAGE